jgi:tRNA1Val (adenine37-N6)-methyltransferase
MGKDTFYFRRFAIMQGKTAMKIGMDSMLLGACVPVQNGMHVLDIGTGTGVLSLMLAQKGRIKIDAIEVDMNAFEEATKNITNSSFSNRISVKLIALQDFKPLSLFDLVICNPPYFKVAGKAAAYKTNQRHLARNADNLDPFDLPSLV